MPMPGFLFNKVASLVKETLAQVFFCGFCVILGEGIQKPVWSCVVMEVRSKRHCEVVAKHVLA